MACGNTIKQLAVALHTHHDTYQTFPVGGGLEGKHAAPFWSAHNTFIRLLPFMEQSAFYDEIMASTANPWHVPELYSANSAMMFACPSEPLRGQRVLARVSTNTTYPSSYVVSLGDTTLGSRFDNDATKMMNRRGFYGGRYVVRTMSDLLDGTSNTIAYSETIVGEQGDKRVGAGISATETEKVVNGVSVVENPRDCLSRATGKEYNGAIIANEIRGQMWFIAGSSQHCFETILPPNSPSCGVNGGSSWDRPTVLSAASNHTGGVMVALCDGSVRFFANTISTTSSGVTDLTDPYSRAVVPGESPYGVWGALGTIDGGDAVNL
ncbi:MAG TPA: hypothetical protein DEB39_09995 [Planctomycetaceae bacterium]|nr:hypothetical protein [Planctomycetaceae bacterium]